MRKYLSYILIIISVAGFLATPSVIEAQTQTRGCWQNGRFIRLGFITIDDCQRNGVWVNIGDPVPPPPHGPSSNTTTQNQGTCWSNGNAIAVFPNITVDGCNDVGVWQPSGSPIPPPPHGPTNPNAIPSEGAVVSRGGDDPSWWVRNVIQPATAWTVTTVLKFVSLFTALGGLVLNGAVFHTIVNMSENYGKLPAIEGAWKTIRDLCNMTFIFILLYAAIETILGIGKDTKGLIVRVVVVAILINFSLFFTKVVIDVANLITLTFYDAIVPSAATKGLGGVGLSNAFMQHLNLQHLYQAGDAQRLSVPSIITTGIMGSIMLLIAAFVFFSVALMFVIRYVVLIVVLILSPIAFISFVLPKTDGYRKQWSEALINQSFFAPIYMALTWITLRILSDITRNIGAANPDTVSAVSLVSRESVSDPQGFLTTLLNFAVVIAFLIISLVIAKEWSGKTAGGVGKLTNWATGLAGTATFGLAAGTARLAADRFTLDPRSDKYKRLEADSAKKGIGGTMARLRLSAADKARTSSFDIRGSRLGSAISGAGVDMGQPGGKGGYEADRKAVREFFEVEGTESYKKRQERARKAEVEREIGNNASQANQYALNLPEIEEIEADARATGVMTPAQGARMAELKKPQAAAEIFEKAITKASTKEIEAIVDSNRKLLDNQEFANKLSLQQLEALVKSDKFSEADKDVLKRNRLSPAEAFFSNPKKIEEIEADARATGVMTPAQAAEIARLNKSVDKSKKFIKNLSDSEIEMVNQEWLGDNEFVNVLKQSQVDSLLKSSKFTRTQKDRVREIRREPLLNYIKDGNLAKVESIIKKTDHKVLAGYMGVPGKRGVNIAMEPEVIKVYTPSILKKMANEMNADDIQTLRNQIISVRDPHVKSVIDMAKRAGGTPDQVIRIAEPAIRASNDEVIKWLFDRGNGKGLDVFN